MQKFSGTRIEAISACVPKTTVKTTDFSHLLNQKDMRKFEKTTGIRERGHAQSMVTAADLAFYAAQDVLKEIKDKRDIKGLVFVSQTADYKIPFTSNILQHRLGLHNNLFCLDINAGCAGFVQGLSCAYSLAQSTNGKIMLIIAETLSKILSNKDKTTATLFGDGAAALLISNNPDDCSLSHFDFFSDGGNFDSIIIPDGGYRNPYSSESLKWHSDNNGNLNQGIHLSMDGQKVFDFTLREIPKSILSILTDTQNTTNTIDYFLMHQSNKFILNQIGRALELPKEKIPINIDRFGNTSGVSIPLIIVTELKDKIQEDKKIVLTGYGSGLNWGNCILTLKPDLCINDLIEI